MEWRTAHSEHDAIQMLKQGRFKYVHLSRKVKYTPNGLDNLAESLIETEIEGLYIEFPKSSAGRILNDLAQSILQGKRIQVLWFERNLSEAHIIAFSQALRANDTARVFRLESVPISFESAKALAMLLATSLSLEEFLLIDAGIKNSQLKPLSLTLGVNKRLQLLDLSHNNIADEGCAYLGEALGANRYLLRINLSNNNIGSVGAECLAKGLTKDSAITELNLGSNYIGDAGISSLVSALMNSGNIRHLNIRKNNIHDTGALEVAKLLEEDKCALQSLDLASNQIGNRAVEAIGDRLFDNSTLLSLSLVQNPFDSLEALLHGVSYNSTLVELKIGGQEYNEENLSKIRSKTEENYAAKKIKDKKDAFRNALKYGIMGPWMRCKLMVIGQGGAGKTATGIRMNSICEFLNCSWIVRSLQGQTFMEKHISTVGAELSQTEVGTKDWRLIANEDYSHALDFAAKRTAELTLASKASGKQKKAPVAEKPSKTRTKITKNVASELPEERINDFVQEKRIDDDHELEKIILKAASEKDSVTLSVWDYGGQDVFYTLHHVFLTKYGVYLLVFNLKEVSEESGKDTAKEYLKFWLNSVRLHASSAPLFLVGTFYNDISEHAMRQIVQTVETLTRDIKQQLVTSSEDLKIFTIDNKSGYGVANLRARIENVVRTLDFVHSPVSPRWMQCLDEMQKKREESWITLSDVTKISEIFGIQENREIFDMLNLFNELGVVLYFTATHYLREVVIVDPQWLIDAIAKVIRDEALHHHDMGLVEEAGLKEDLETMFTRGIATKDILNFLWQGVQVEFLIDLMTHMMLISRWSYQTELEGQELFLVPSLFKDTAKHATSGRKCIIAFSFLPLGVFQRLICVCIAVVNAQYPKTLEPSFSKRYAKIYFGNDTVHIKEDGDKIIVYFESDRLASTILSVIVSALAKIKTDVMGTGLVWKTQVQVGDNEFIEYQKALHHKITPWFQEKVKALSQQDLNNFVENS